MFNFFRANRAVNQIGDPGNFFVDIDFLPFFSGTKSNFLLVLLESLKQFPNTRKRIHFR